MKQLRVGIYHLGSKLVVVLTFAWYLALFVKHSTYVTSTAYSSPSVVLASRLADGSQYIIDDYREAYYWLRMNTPDDARVMSWYTSLYGWGLSLGGIMDIKLLVWQIAQLLLTIILGITLISLYRQQPSSLIVDRWKGNVKQRRSILSNPLKTRRRLRPRHIRRLTGLFR